MIKHLTPQYIFLSEKHFKNVRQLTFGSDNAEAYFGFDQYVSRFSQQIPAKECWVWSDIFSRLDKFEPALVSTGKGEQPALFLPGSSLILYASTHLGSKWNVLPKATTSWS